MTRFTVQTRDRQTQGHVSAKASHIYNGYQHADGDFVIDGEFHPEVAESLMHVDGVVQIDRSDRMTTRTDVQSGRLTAINDEPGSRSDLALVALGAVLL